LHYWHLARTGAVWRGRSKAGFGLSCITKLSVSERGVESLCEKHLVSVRPPPRSRPAPRFCRGFRGRGRLRERGGLRIRVFFTQALYAASLSLLSQLSLNSNLVGSFTL